MNKRIATTIGTMFLVLALTGVINAADIYRVGTLNLNTATVEQLVLLPGTNPDMAQKIIAFRDSNGAFATTEELIKIEGMTYRQIDNIRAYLTLDGQTTLHRDKSMEYGDLLEHIHIH